MKGVMVDISIHGHFLALPQTGPSRELFRESTGGTDHSQVGPLPDHCLCSEHPCKHNSFPKFKGQAAVNMEMKNGVPCHWSFPTVTAQASGKRGD